MSDSSGERGSAVLWAALALVLILAGCGPFAGFLQPKLPGDEPAACGDGMDNDGDGRADFPEDPGCASLEDPSELDPLHLPECSDGLDNDMDGRIDFDQDGNGMVDPEDDPGCLSASGDNELNVVLPQCADGVDNDGDQRIDLADPQCSGLNDTDEAN